LNPGPVTPNGGGQAVPRQSNSIASSTWSIVEATKIENLHRQDVIRALAELFLALVGILYATGFLAAFTFLQRFGVREAGTDFLKLKYIYVGILYSLFPLTIMLPLFGLWGLWRQSKQSGRSSLKSTPISFVTILLLLNMAAVFYVFICFSPVTFLHTRPWVISSVSVPTIVGVLLFRFLEAQRLRRRLARWNFTKRPFLYVLKKTRETRRRLRSRELTQQWPWRALVWWRKLGGGRTVLFLAIVGLVDNPSMHGLWKDLRLMFWGDSHYGIVIHRFKITAPIGGFNYYLFVLLYLVVAYRVLRRIRRHTGVARTRFLLAGGGLWLSLFIVSVLAFAIRVYPFIPAHKGGGDYRKTAATIVLKDAHGLALPEAVVIIEETDAALFVAIPSETPIPKTENTVAEGKWRLWDDLPTVIEIPREAVAYMHYWPPGKKNTGGSP
jgi:hypothetical protein